MLSQQRTRKHDDDPSSVVVIVVVVVALINAEGDRGTKCGLLSTLLPSFILPALLSVSACGDATAGCLINDNSTGTTIVILYIWGNDEFRTGDRWRVRTCPRWPRHD